jgi:hypothetical protein
MNQNQTNKQVTAQESQSYKVLYVLRSFSSEVFMRDIIDELNNLCIDYTWQLNKISQNMELLVPNSEFNRGKEIMKDYLKTILNNSDRN